MVENSSLGRLADSLYGAAGRDSGADEREDLLGNPHQTCCDFVTTYLSAIVQHESFLELEPRRLLEPRLLDLLLQRERDH